MKTYNKIIKNIKYNLGSGYEDLTLEEFIKAFHVTVNVADVKLKDWRGEVIETISGAEFIHFIDSDISTVEGIYLCSHRKIYNIEDFIIEW